MVRSAPNLIVEASLLSGEVRRVACVDEVGRGAVAGPVSVGAVLLSQPMGVPPSGLADSKFLSPARRSALVEPIVSWAEACAVGHASAGEVDSLGVNGALRLAALRAFAAVPHPDVVLLDGAHDWISPLGRAEELSSRREDGETLPVVPKGSALAGSGPVRVMTRVAADATCAGVAAASVLAKVERDAVMVELADDHPGFGFDRNKGYATAEHVAGLRDLGPSSVHRVSWRLPS